MKFVKVDLLYQVVTSVNVIEATKALKMKNNEHRADKIMKDCSRQQGARLDYKT